MVVAEYWDESGKIIEMIEEAEDESLNGLSCEKINIFQEWEDKNLDKE